MSEPRASWAAELRTVVDRIAAMDLGYPAGTNEVRPPVEAPAGVPEGLRAMYAACDGASLPDLHVGYFIDTSARAATAAERGEPIRIEGQVSTRVHVFGSDGGGGRFALGEDGAVYYLPSGGLVEDGVFFEDSHAKARIVGQSLDRFLDRVSQDADAFVTGRTGHRYLVDP